jgi:hypothetical protein
VTAVTDELPAPDGLPVLQFAVTVFGGPNPNWCDMNHCPVLAYGPFARSELARAYAGTLPGWMRPHVVTLEPVTVTPSAAHSTVPSEVSRDPRPRE